jgi:polyhydroxyalkanoate synthase
VPIFAVGTQRDHVAPWRSTYKIHLQSDTEVTYLLATGGHNDGIVSEPGRDGRSFQVLTKTADDRYVDPEAWLAQAPRRQASWWLEWVAWLDARSGAPVAPPGVGAAAAGLPVLGDAPAATCCRNELHARAELKPAGGASLRADARAPIKHPASPLRAHA